MTSLIHLFVSAVTNSDTEVEHHTAIAISIILMLFRHVEGVAHSTMTMFVQL